MKIRAYTKNKGWGFFHIYIGKMKYTNYHYTLSYNLKPFNLELTKTKGLENIITIFKIKLR